MRASPPSFSLLIILTTIHVCYISVYQIICRGCFFRRKTPASQEEPCGQGEQEEEEEASRAYLV